MKANAMVLLEPGKMELREFDVVTPRSDQILVKTTATSICASDPKIFHGQTPFSVYPLIPGHEIAGRVEDIGKKAAAFYGLEAGDRITIEPSIPCGHCEWCRTGFSYHKCRPLYAYGVTMAADQPPYLFGGYGEYMYLQPGSLVYRLADTTPDLAACLSSVIGNGVRWVKTLGNMTFGQSLVISGAGSQGLAALMAARECGVGPIVMLGLTRDKARFELAREFGLDHVINIEETDPLEAVPDLLKGSPDVVIETSGIPSAIQTALDLVRMLGRVISIGISAGKETPITFDTLVVKGVTILCDHAQAGNYPDAMKILNSGKYPIEKISNVTYSLEELPRALAETDNPPEGFIKGAIVFD